MVSGHACKMAPPAPAGRIAPGTAIHTDPHAPFQNRRGLRVD